MQVTPKEGCATSPLVVGFAGGGLMGMTITLTAMLCFMRDPSLLAFALVVSGLLGSATGGIFAPMTYPFIRTLHPPTVVAVLAGSTFIFGMAPSLVFYFYYGYKDMLPLLNWPAGMLGYWIAFLFRHEIVGIVNWWQARRSGNAEKRT